MQYPASELVLDTNGCVYHLGLSPENISSKIILVGDQDRVAMISSFFDTIEHQSQHREFVCHTGIFKGKRISALSTGIGTDNIDITMNELDALFNIDLVERKDKEIKTSLEIIRIGTCGVLQPEIPVHSYLLSSHAFGLDNIAHFYQIEFSEKEVNLKNAMIEELELPVDIQPYLISSTSDLTNRLKSEKTHIGITVTSSGFYGPQGRQLRVPNSVKHLNERLTNFKRNSHRVVNFEMESSAIFALGRAMGHQCATICLGVANRPKMEFSKGYKEEMNALISYVLERI
ncbi:MAG: nucleoside phosphorylase [Flavobacteriia bacterium]|jgi:uridine phosphorylase